MGTLLSIAAVILVVAGVITVLSGSVIAGIVLVVIGCIVGPGGVLPLSPLKRSHGTRKTPGETGVFLSCCNASSRSPSRRTRDLVSRRC